jgi:hypothetical protein
VVGVGEVLETETPSARVLVAEGEDMEWVPRRGRMVEKGWMNVAMHENKKSEFFIITMLFIFRKSGIF